MSIRIYTWILLKSNRWLKKYYGINYNIIITFLEQLLQVGIIIIYSFKELSYSPKKSCKQTESIFLNSLNSYNLNI